MRTCNECGAQFRNKSNEHRCKPCVAMYEPIAVWARNAVTRAVKQGALANLREAHVPCADCGNRACRYDHRDYLKPLNVEPVCRACNAKRGPAIPCVSRVTDTALAARSVAGRERREAALRRIGRLAA